jgi:hypothetical protein
MNVEIGDREPYSGELQCNASKLSANRFRAQ